MHGQSMLGHAPVAPTEVSAPLLPGMPPPAARHHAVHALTAPVVAGAAAMSPLIRPLAAAPAVLTSWSAVPEIAAPLLAAPLPDTTSSPSPPASSRTAR